MRLIDADALLKEMDYHFRHLGRAEEVRNMINSLPTLESPRDWTPCADGLPEENGTYLVFAPSYRGGSSSGLDVINGIMFSRFKSGKWSIEHGYYNRPNCVIAWQPLPDPYNTDHMRDTTKKVDQFREPTKKMQED